MRIPLKVALPLLILLPLVIWIAGTRRYDFLVPRNIPASELRPEFARPVNRELVDSILPATEPAPPAPPSLDPGNFFEQPTLDQYLSQSDQGAPALFKLGEQLQNAGRIQRAVLAYERVLDATPSGGQERVQAEEALANLKGTLPRWNQDPTKAIPLLINIATAREAASLEAPLAALSELILVSSGNLCLPQFKIHQSPTPQAALPALPLAMWLTVVEEEPDEPSLAVLTIAPSSESELDSRLTHALYRLISRRLRNDPDITEPSALLLDDDPEKAIVTKITRRSWMKLLTSPFQRFVAPEDDLIPVVSDDEDTLENGQE